jgi:hypothetical protein
MGALSTPPHAYPQPGHVTARNINNWVPPCQWLNLELFGVSTALSAGCASCPAPETSTRSPARWEPHAAPRAAPSKLLRLAVAANNDPTLGELREHLVEALAADPWLGA